MNKELLEKGIEVQDTSEKNNYQQYLELGGIINEKDYQNALTRTENTSTPDEITIQQVRSLARPARIDLPNPEDKRIVLYGILQELKFQEIKDSDFRLFREALRILGDTDALDKLKDTYHTKRPVGTYCPLCRQTMFSENCP